MSAPSGLIEELELERVFLASHQEYALACFRARQYRAWQDAKENVASARERVAKLEQELAREETR